MTERYCQVEFVPVDGCGCQEGTYMDETSQCVSPNNCPCYDQNVVIPVGETISRSGGTCMCKDRQWQCTTQICDGVCAIYGEGHYITFDEKRFNFNGNCEYILVQDYCGNTNGSGSFRVLTENVPCGTKGTTCSKTITLFLGGQVCGLCGNYDGNTNNDFTTRAQATVVDPVEFGNSWTVSSSCPSVLAVADPCASNPYRTSWAQKQCSIIKSDVFAACQTEVDPSPYYDACVSDSCACDSGGDCECFCTAVAAYAKACNEAGACIAWRTPRICPLFCDYYNPVGECEWHYKPCGAQCMKTCQNPTGNCSSSIPALEVPTSLCICTVNGTQYLPGDLVYNVTDGSGWCYTAYCKETCQVEVDSKPCPSPNVCKPAICEIINSNVFELCHKAVSPESYVQACRNDVCITTNSSCASLEAYASACSSKGICIDWRNSTSGQCAHQCPASKVYMPCGPAVQPTCNSRYNDKFLNTQTQTTITTQEGCFCPSGTTLFSTYSDTCVAVCGCTGPDGNPKMPGDVWDSGCQECTCDKASMEVHCQPMACPTPTMPTCNETGYRLVNQTDGCCFNSSCECDAQLCPALKMDCEIGWEPFISTLTTSCCAEYSCVPKAVCVYNNTEYQPGSTVPKATCEDCTCTSTTDPSTQLKEIVCTMISCSTTCSLGFELQAVPDQCCGKCVQTSCIINMPDNTTQPIQVNETWSPPDDKCAKYTCDKTSGQYIPVETRTACPPYQPENCVAGTEQTDADGCCTTCTEQSNVCKMTNTTTSIVINDCSSETPVEINSCSGSCGTSSMYSAVANTMVHHCSCCQEATTSELEVELTCSDGSKVMHKYVHVESCGCHITDCDSGTPTGAAAIGKKRRRRR
ncbi:hypothetical protein DPEC_G00255610 [Dallia pectoralis]|uniref:Uncharacterized protein n=1 Tax=Dallia pectoralis TaxID=75939 RepID=A0ACC2FUF3_DALPE|nr:hypothetical protein DPEC_G00255610 [Dallia pectoralis]